MDKYLTTPKRIQLSDTAMSSGKSGLTNSDDEMLAKIPFQNPDSRLVVLREYMFTPSNYALRFRGVGGGLVSW
jgi:hypothetical protein